MAQTQGKTITSTAIMKTILHGTMGNNMIFDIISRFSILFDYFLLFLPHLASRLFLWIRNFLLFCFRFYASTMMIPRPSLFVLHNEGPIRTDHPLRRIFWQYEVIQPEDFFFFFPAFKNEIFPGKSLCKSSRYMQTLM